MPKIMPGEYALIRRDHSHACMHKGAVMLTCACAQMLDHAFAYVNRKAGSFLHVYAGVSASMHTRVYTQSLYQAYECIHA